MSDVIRHAPQLSNCPYCGERPDSETYLDIQDDSPTFLAMSESPPALEDMSFDLTRCIKFHPCGHVFEKESIDSITDALRELRSLKTERRNCEDGDRLKELDYELEAQVHAVNNRASEATRRPEAEDDHDE